jgi:hypothetical protein
LDHADVSFAATSPVLERRSRFASGAAVYARMLRGTITKRGVGKAGDWRETKRDDAECHAVSSQ